MSTVLLYIWFKAASRLSRKYFKRSVINVGIRMYNKMPTKIKQLESFRDFKQRLKLFLLDHFYSLNEFFSV